MPLFLSREMENVLIMPPQDDNNIMNDGDNNNTTKINNTQLAIIDIEEPIKPIHNGYTAKTADEVVRIARAAFKSDKTRSVDFREQQLRKLQNMYNENEQAMFDALSKDLCKSRQESSLTEVEFLKNDITNVLMHFKEWIKPEKAETDLANFFNDLHVYSDPFGVVLIIGAWNYPIQLSLLPLAGAIAAGNCVIIKPSEMAVATSTFIAETLPKYLDPECYQVFEGGVTETQALLQHRFDYIFFTGSPMVGRLVHQAAARHLTPTTLELGGKSPTYIDDTVNYDFAAARLLWGKCVNAGQTCIAPDYVLCRKDVQDKLVEAMRKVLTKWYGGNVKSSPDFCRIINDRHFNRLLSLMQYGKIVIGGDYDAKERYIEPTVIVDVDIDDPIMNDEIFGPILPIINVDSIHDAIAFINQREKPLALYIFSNNKDDVDLMLGATSSGGACVNDTLLHICAESLPFGGVGNSGMGNYHGRRSFDTFVHKKGVLKKGYAAILEKAQEARYPPYTEKKQHMLSQLMKKRTEFPTKIATYVLIFFAGIFVAILLRKMG